MDGTQWGMLWNRLFENLLGGAAQISTISLSQRDPREIGASSAWRVAGVRTALIVGRSGDTIASTFPH